MLQAHFFFAGVVFLRADLEARHLHIDLGDLFGQFGDVALDAGLPFKRAVTRFLVAGKLLERRVALGLSVSKRRNRRGCAWRRHAALS